MPNNEIRGKFRKIKTAGERNGMSAAEKIYSDKAVAEYMESLLENAADDFLTAGFCLWNISDSYAMMRDGESLYKNHCRFKEFLSGKPDIYRIWAVTDTTQRFTLVSSGHESFWHELYRDSLENGIVNKENYRAVYEAHRAAMAVHPSLKIPEKHLIYAAERFSGFIDERKIFPEYAFYRLIYLSAAMKAFGQTDICLEELCAEHFNNLKLNDTPTEFVCGEWQHLNRERSAKNMAVVGITAAVNALIDTGEKRRAAELYRAAGEQGLPRNKYAAARLDC